MNRRRPIRSKSYEEAKIRDILRPGKTQSGTRDTEAEIRDVPGNTGRLASLSRPPYSFPTPLLTRLRITLYGATPLYFLLVPGE